MMQLSPTFAGNMATLEPREAWQTIVEEVLSICAQPLAMANAAKAITDRERQVGLIDNLLSSTAWELWNVFPSCVETNSASLVSWWRNSRQGKAILILDGLSLRELPWLLEGAREHGFAIRKNEVHAAEIPAETQHFAKSLGYSSRASLVNNSGGASHLFPKATTECVSMPWKDAAALVDARPDWLFWHEWPDIILHRGAGQGQGLDEFSKECAQGICSQDFWDFVARLAQGRSLVITSDHGYAASGLFTDAGEGAAAFLKNQLRSGRSTEGEGDIGPFIPPVMLRHENSHGVHRLALGRWKWRSQGGYPTLTHGGMSLLEVLVPWVELEEKRQP